MKFLKRILLQSVIIIIIIQINVPFDFSYSKKSNKNIDRVNILNSAAAFEIPSEEDWHLYVLSKALLVLTPMLVYNVYHKILKESKRNEVLLKKLKELKKHPVAYNVIHDKLRVSGINFTEKALVHAAFYTGMGLPFIGFDSFTDIIDFQRLVGFTLSNMIIHDMIPHLINGNFFKNFFPEWTKALGVNLKIGGHLLKINAIIGKNRLIHVFPSPHNELPADKFIRKIESNIVDNVQKVVVSFTKNFIPEGSDGKIIFFLSDEEKLDSKSGSGLYAREKGIGEIIKVDLGGYDKYSEPIYVTDTGKKNFLWKQQYWTKLLNEGSALSSPDTPFNAFNKSLRVLIGTPISFMMANAFVHLVNGGVINYDILNFFSYGIILAFTMGGTFGSSISNTGFELISWFNYHRQKFNGANVFKVLSKNENLFQKIFSPDIIETKDEKYFTRRKSIVEKIIPSACERFFISGKTSKVEIPHELIFYDKNISAGRLNEAYMNTSSAYSFTNRTAGIVGGGLLAAWMATTYGSDIDEFIHNKILSPNEKKDPFYDTDQTFFKEIKSEESDFDHRIFLHEGNQLKTNEFDDFKNIMIDSFHSITNPLFFSNIKNNEKSEEMYGVIDTQLKQTLLAFENDQEAKDALISLAALINFPIAAAENYFKNRITTTKDHIEIREEFTTYLELLGIENKYSEITDAFKEVNLSSDPILNLQKHMTGFIELSRFNLTEKIMEINE